MNFEFDIFDNNNLVKKFARDHNIKYIDYEQIFREYFNKHTFPQFQVQNNYSTISTNIDLLSIGDKIKVSYLPYSQKYIDYYQTIYGKIFYLDIENNNGLVYRDENNKKIISSIEKEYCSYFGDTPGYCIYIEKII